MQGPARQYRIPDIKPVTDKMKFLSLVLMLGALSLAACGQKGPLYIPVDPNAAPASTEAGEDQQSEEEAEGTTAD